MIERNPLQHPHNPIGRPKLDQPIKIKRRRNRLLLTLIATFCLLIVWKVIDGLDYSIPDLIIDDTPPISDLHPILLAKQTELLAETSKIGITIVITDSFRSIEKQNALYEQGRSTEGAVVTQVKGGSSYHNYGLAIDFALRTNKHNVIWDMKADNNGNGKSDWMEVVAIAKKLGFSWGGDWENFPDYPHLQMDFGYSIRDLKRGKQPPIE